MWGRGELDIEEGLGVAVNASPSLPNSRPLLPTPSPRPHLRPLQPVLSPSTGIKLDRPVAEALLKAFDPDRTGTLGQAEFIGACLLVRAAGAAFAAFDTGKTGRVTLTLDQCAGYKGSLGGSGRAWWARGWQGVLLGWKRHGVEARTAHWLAVPARPGTARAAQRRCERGPRRATLSTPTPAPRNAPHQSSMPPRPVAESGWGGRRAAGWLGPGLGLGLAWALAGATSSSTPPPRSPASCPLFGTRGLWSVAGCGACPAGHRQGSAQASQRPTVRPWEREPRDSAAPHNPVSPSPAGPAPARHRTWLPH